MIQLEAVEKSYDRAKVIDCIDLDVIPGKTTVLIGPSGCGKSTLLRLILGLIAPDAGRILFSGESLDKTTIFKMRQRIGYVIQDGGLFPHLTAADNISLMAKYLRWNDKKILRRIEVLRAITQFPANGLQRYPVELSGGQKQRVALMRALMLDPDLLLLDEPLGALDPMVRSDLQTDLRTIFRKLGKTTLLVTHNLDEAAYFGDQIVIIRQGQVVQTGSIESIINNPADEFVIQFFNAQRSHV